MLCSNLPSCHADFVYSLAEWLGTAFSGARQHCADFREKLKLYYDGAVHHQPYADPGLTYRIGRSMDSVGQEQIVHYDRLTHC